MAQWLPKCSIRSVIKWIWIYDYSFSIILLIAIFVEIARMNIALTVLLILHVISVNIPRIVIAILLMCNEYEFTWIKRSFWIRFITFAFQLAFKGSQVNSIFICFSSQSGFNIPNGCICRPRFNGWLTTGIELLIFLFWVRTVILNRTQQLSKLDSVVKLLI